MPVEKLENDIQTLVGKISRREIMLPEIQRGRTSHGLGNPG
ncbi:hypothetical protein [Streptosporangium sp. CA-115845]